MSYFPFPEDMKGRCLGSLEVDLELGSCMLEDFEWMRNDLSGQFDTHKPYVMLLESQGEFESTETYLVAYEVKTPSLSDAQMDVVRLFADSDTIRELDVPSIRGASLRSLIKIGIIRMRHGDEVTYQMHSFAREWLLNR